MIPERLERIIERMSVEGCFFQDKNLALEELLRINEGAKNTKQALFEFFEMNHLGERFVPLVEEELSSEEIGSLSLIEGAEEILNLLSRDHTLAIVTAGIPSLQRKKMKVSGISENLFSKILICPPKQKEGFYRECLEDLQFSPRETIVCGDRIEQDLAPAKRLGMNTIHIKQGRGAFQKDIHFDCDFSINSLEEISDLLNIIQNKNLLGAV
jgi:FMN phosphatase YigB (HAD superfamily)